MKSKKEKKKGINVIEGYDVAGWEGVIFFWCVDLLFLCADLSVSQIPCKKGKQILRNSSCKMTSSLAITSMLPSLIVIIY